MRQRSLGTLFICLCMVGAMLPAQAQGSASAAAAAAAALKAAAAAKPHAPKAYDDFVKGATVTDGLFPIVQKDGKTYLVVKTAQLGADFVETSVPSSGLGGFGPAQGEPYVAPARIMHFERVDDTVVLRWPNSYTIAPKDSPAALGVHNSLPSSIIAVEPIVAQNDDQVVISADPFLGDVADMAASFQQVSGNPMHGYHLDPSRTFFSKTEAFPLNDVLRVDQTWASADPDAIDNAPDARSVEVNMTYNLIQAPNDGYVPRYYDPRVGYFSEPLMNFGTDNLLRRDQHYIARWNFGKRTSSAPFTATNPITFYLSNDIPDEYRATVAKALLTWNDAFRRIGILNAVQVKQQPADPSWSPDDIRHNMIRWIDTSNPQFGAEALLLDDPRSGEELNVGVNFDAIEGLGGRLIYKYEIAPARGLPDSVAAERNYTEGFIRSVILHESGHDLGLQHNFIGSMAYTAKDLQSRAFTDRYGVATSVMEYAPLNLWPKGTPQGDYDQLVLGPYDYYAVKYGYGYIPDATTPDQELPTLQQWASRWSDPTYRFASDEDADLFSNGHSIDPRVVTFDLTNKPLQWCNVQMGLMHRLMNDVNQRFPQAGMPYDEARAAFLMPMRGYLRCATMAADTIGGEYISRSLPTDPGAKPPLQPVSRSQEIKAWKVLRDGLFSDSAWRFNPQVLETLTYSEDSSLSNGDSWGYNPPDRHDVPVAELVGAAQEQTLDALFAPMRLQRLDAMPFKYGTGRTMSLGDLFTWARVGILGDLSTGAVNEGVIRRNLQVVYVKMLGQMWTDPKAGTPADAQALARFELENVRHEAAIGSARPHLSDLDRAHLGALEAIANQALEAHATIAAPQVPQGAALPPALEY